MNSIKNLTPIQVSIVTHFLFLFSAVLIVLALPKTKKKLDPIKVQVLEISKQENKVPAIDISQKPLPKPKESTPPPVFGLTKNSLTSEGAEVSVKLGNTIAKEIDKTADDGASLPIPVDDYLISKMPKVLNEVRVPYPAEARKQGIAGAVIVDLLIDGEGVVREAQLVKGLSAELDNLAIEALKKFKFQPAFVGDKAVPVKIRYSYRFTLE